MAVAGSRCRNEEVFATGNLSYSDPKLTVHKLSYIPTKILSTHFPISIKNDKLFLNTICDNILDFKLPRKRFQAFQVKIKNLMYIDVSKKNMTFHSHFIHRTLSKLQKLKTTDIVQATSSYAFVFYCILAISVIVILLFCCCCPGLMISMVKCIIGNMMQFLSYVIALGYEGLQVSYFKTI